MNFGQPLSPQQTATYLRTLPAIRERCTKVHELAKKGELQYFEYHPEKENEVADFCLSIIQVRLSVPSLVSHLFILFPIAKLWYQLRLRKSNRTIACRS